MVGITAAGALSSRPRLGLELSAVALVVTAALISAHVVAPLANHWPLPWSYLMFDYVHAMGHRLYDGPYAFFYTPPWVYDVSAFTPLVVPAAALTAAFAVPGLKTNRAVASTLAGSGVLVVAVFVGAVTYVLTTTRGFPL